VDYIPNNAVTPNEVLGAIRRTKAVVDDAF
jgi:hypothetical protein